MSSRILIATPDGSFGHSGILRAGMYGAGAALLMVAPPNLLLAALLFGMTDRPRVGFVRPISRTRLRGHSTSHNHAYFSQIFTSSFSPGPK